MTARIHGSTDIRVSCNPAQRIAPITLELTFGEHRAGRSILIHAPATAWLDTETARWLVEQLQAALAQVGEDLEDERDFVAESELRTGGPTDPPWEH